MEGRPLGFEQRLFWGRIKYPVRHPITHAFLNTTYPLGTNEIF